jgi:transposase
MGEMAHGSMGGRMEFPRLNGQEVKPMIKEGSIMGARSVFTKEFKERAVERALNTNRKHSEIAQDLGINRNMLARWMREVKQRETRPMKAFTGRGNARDEQMARLRKENVGLRETNEILKKAIAIFTGGNPR